MYIAMAITPMHITPPVIAFMRRGYISVSGEKRAMSTVCRPSIDIIAATRFTALAAERIGMPKRRDLARLTIALMNI